MHQGKTHSGLFHGLRNRIPGNVMISFVHPEVGITGYERIRERDLGIVGHAPTPMERLRHVEREISPVGRRDEIDPWQMHDIAIEMEKVTLERRPTFNIYKLIGI